MQTDTPVTLAVIIGAHGVTGEVRLKVFTDDLGSYKSFNSGTLSLKSVRHGSNGAIARIAEVTDRNAAEALRGTELTVARSALPPLADGEYYHADLLGLPAVSPNGETLGHVVAIDDFGAGDVIEIERPRRQARDVSDADRGGARMEWRSAHRRSGLDRLTAELDKILLLL